MLAITGIGDQNVSDNPDLNNEQNLAEYNKQLVIDFIKAWVRLG